MDLILTEKPLAARCLVKTGFYGAPTSFKQYQNIYFKNDKFIIFPCVGHLYEREKPYEVDPIFGFAWKKVEGYNYGSEELLKRVKLKPKPNAKKIIAALKEILKSGVVKNIYHNGDADPEGEAITRLALMESGVNVAHIPQFRVFNTGSFDSFAVVKKAWEECLPLSTSKYENLFASRTARDDADYFSQIFCRVYTDKTQSKFRFGRVWMALVSLIYNRELTIRNFVPQNYATIKVYQGQSSKDKQALVFTAFREGEELLETGETKKIHTTQFFDDSEPSPAQIIEAVKNANYIGKVVKNRKYESKEGKPKMYSLNDFNSEFIPKYKVTAEYTEACLEFLRFKGFLHYIRTDGNYFFKAALDKVQEIRGHALEVFGNDVKELKKQDKNFDVVSVTTDLPLFNDKAANDQNHEPIHILKSLTESDIAFLKSSQPSHENPKLQLKHLYECYMMVAKRCLIQFMPDAIATNQDVVIDIGGHLFETSTTKTSYLGWKAFDSDARISNSKDLNFNLDEGQEIKFDGVDSENHKTTCPKRYTENTLRDACNNVKKALIEEINAIEDADERKKRFERYKNTVKMFESAKGIGTQGTLKDIFSKAENDGVFQRVKSELHPTDYGWFVYNTVHPYLRSLELTAILESYLIEIRSGRKTVEQFHNEFLYGVFSKLAREEAERNIKVAPRQISQKQIQFAENMAKALKIELPKDYKTDFAVISQFIENNKLAYDKLFSKVPEYIVESFKVHQDKVSPEVFALIDKDEISKEEYVKAIEVFKNLPKIERTYSTFLPTIIEVVNKNADRLDKEIVEIANRNSPTSDEYKKVMSALNQMKRVFSEKMWAVIERNKENMSARVQELIEQGNSGYDKNDYELIKAEVDKVFESFNKEKTKSKSTTKNSTKKK